ncbi:MAG: DUF3536 domain-containing protein [Gemmatimonadota bacterium]
MSTSSRSVVLHGHFYQPPREDPWFETVDAQSTAAPDHDWNARVERECYRAVVAARILDGDGRIQQVVNTLEHISFNVGPTLLSWMEWAAPRTYNAILDADQRSRERLGHGNALAMAYHHPILPLSDPRDRLTEIRWGMHDFRQRFGRDPEGMWLPETAVDDATLDALATEGIRFTVLAPYQIDPVPADGGPALYRTKSGREIALFAYDGDLARGVAFGELLSDAERWVARWVAPSDPRRLVSIAVDGETFGHHHRFADLALAAALHHLAQRTDVRVENFASYLERHPPREEVTLIEPSAWSCAHGVDRWRRECGCKMDPSSSTRQTWRTPLRDAVTWLAKELHSVFETEGVRHFVEPWRARDAYGRMVGRLPAEARLAALIGELAEPVNDGVRALELLEMERNALRLFTSCAWFFDDLAGIEPVQILRYAARGIDLAGAEQVRIEQGFRARLAEARSNDPEEGSGADLYDRRARPSASGEARAAAGGSLLYEEQHEDFAGFGAFRTHSVRPGHVVVTHEPTGHRWEMTAEVRARGPAALVVDVGEGSERERVEAGELPEAARRPLERGLRARLLGRVLNDDDRAALAEGAPLTEVARGACLRAVAELTAEGPGFRDPLVRSALDAAGLLVLLGLDLPFDAQTDLWRWLEALGQPPQLAELARQYGLA